MTTQNVQTAPRMKAAERRELILEAATAVFGANSYVGTTTDEVARAAGVSQPYVVRLFGTKAKLYIAVIERAYERIISEFSRVLPGPPDERLKRMGAAYAGLLSERGMLPVIANSTALGGDPEIGPVARDGFNGIWRFVRDEAGFSEEETREFMAGGMLINAIVGLRLVGAYGTEKSVTEVLDACFPDAVARVRELMPQVGEPW
ncbi:TetR/AcrR family transcriptional regulator [Agromyces sp. SYSU K20354]|uniref:TetR/AcrR family transcriptional regulator n=1 Tax=Agromyces cavernae TaxID=2898659 RepID=UPI001E364366|nr:helix-turn-helix domain-containing protein [Agromyces cavernae]MCD2441109.1 TetR/AcrR family transcriptional regulator [Agromyces cavernae]